MSKHIATVVQEYINKYLIEHGKKPSCIYLSKQRLVKYEKELGCEKIEAICGIKVYSHTYHKYKENL